MLCEECVKCAKAGKQEGLIKVGTEDDKYIFTVESTGALSPQIIVSSAFEIILKKLGDV